MNNTARLTNPNLQLSYIGVAEIKNKLNISNNAEIDFNGLPDDIQQKIIDSLPPNTTNFTISLFHLLQILNIKSYTIITDHNARSIEFLLQSGVKYIGSANYYPNLGYSPQPKSFQHFTIKDLKGPLNHQLLNMGGPISRSIFNNSPYVLFFGNQEDGIHKLVSNISIELCEVLNGLFITKS